MKGSERADSGPGNTIDGGDPVADASDTLSCRHSDPFEAIAPVLGVNTGDEEHNAWLAGDENTIVYTRWPTGETVGDFFIATRDEPDGTFGGEEPLSVNTDDDEWRAWLSDDLRTIYFDRRPAAGGAWDILVATRSSPAGDFGVETPVTNVSDETTSEFDPFVAGDGMYYGTSVDSNIQLWFAPADGDGFAAGDPIMGVNSGAADELPVPSFDRLALYFGARDRNPDGEDWDVWVAVRQDADEPFGDPTRLEAPVGSAGREYPSWLSQDNCRLYFTSEAGGDHDVWVATRTPPG